MHLARLALLGLIVISGAGCRSAAAAGSPGPALDSRPMVAFTRNQICSLLSADEATALLGRPLVQVPEALGPPGHQAQCIYRTSPILAAGTYIRVEINETGFTAEAVLVDLQRGAHTLSVGGYQAIGAEAQTDPTVAEAVLSVRIATLTSDPALWIEAPTSELARQVADLVLPRLVGLQ